MFAVKRVITPVAIGSVIGIVAGVGLLALLLLVADTDTILPL